MVPVEVLIAKALKETLSTKEEHPTNRELKSLFKNSFVGFSNGSYCLEEKETKPTIKSTTSRYPDYEIEFVKGDGVPYVKYAKQCDHIIIRYDSKQGQLELKNVYYGKLDGNDFSYSDNFRTIKKHSLQKLSTLF